MAFNYKIILFAVSLVVCETHSQISFSSNYNNIFGIQLRKQDPLCTTSTGYYRGLKCKNCDTAIICGPGGSLIREAKCSNITSAKTRYCDSQTNTCVEANTCANIIEMKCKYEGFFPNPMNCNKFIYCEGNNMEPQHYECPNSTRYDHSKQSCSLNVPCITFSSRNGLCQRKPYEFVPYPGDASIFTYCQGTEEVSELYTCDKNDEILDLNNYGTCILGCKSEGLFKDAVDDTTFYICYKEGSIFKKATMKCNEGTKFEINGKFCKTKPVITTLTPEIIPPDIQNAP